MNIQKKAAMIKSLYGEKTDLRNEFSYGNGVPNMLGLLRKKGTGLSLRLSIKNTSAEQKTVYFMPSHTVKGSNTDQDTTDDLLNAAGLPAGVVFFRDYVGEDTEGAPVTEVEIKSLNRDQKLSEIAQELAFSPIQIIGMAQNSYNATTGAPENGNNSNTITHYNVSAFRPKRYQDLNLSQFQSAKNLSNDILKVDFFKENFVCPISGNDIFAIQVNANTKIDLSLMIGARDSRSEYFYRQITAGQDLLVEGFSDEINANCDCN